MPGPEMLVCGSDPETDVTYSSELGPKRTWGWERLPVEVACDLGFITRLVIL